MKRPRLKKFLKVAAWTLAVLVTLAFLFFAIENWRGAREWAETKAWLKAEGESLDFSELWPDPVRAEENFWSIPLLKSVSDFEYSFSGEGEPITYRDPEMRERFLKMALPDADDESQQPKVPGWVENGPIDLEAWAAFLRLAEGFDTGDAGKPAVEQIRSAFSQFDDDFSVIAEAARTRLEAQIPVKFREGMSWIEMVSVPMPEFSDLSRFTKFLTVKGCAAIAAGDTGTARDCILIPKKLGEAVGSKPILLSHLIERSFLSRAGAIIREGILSRSWTESDLKWIINQIEQINLHSRAANAIRGEIYAFFRGGIEFLKSGSRRDWDVLFAGDHSTIEGVAWLVIPDGWLDQNASIGCRKLYQHAILPLKSGDFFGIADDPLKNELRSKTPYNFIASATTPVTGGVLKRTVEAQTLLEAAQVSCALELYFLKEQKYPESLEILVPEFLPSIPNDPISSEPLRFKKAGDRYRIWAVGLNGKDDGGVVARKENGGKVGREQGDWVWACDVPKP